MKRWNGMMYSLALAGAAAAQDPAQVKLAQAQAALEPRFHEWVAATATTDAERAKLPVKFHRAQPKSAFLNSASRVSAESQAATSFFESIARYS